MAEKLDFQIGLFQNGFNIKIKFFEYLEAWNSLNTRYLST